MAKQNDTKWDDTLYDSSECGDLSASEGDDFIYGGDGHDAITGASGQDHIFCEPHNTDDNWVLGLVGEDSLFVGSSDAQMAGGSGHETLTGEADNDMLSGSTGGGRFVVEGAAGDDTITDFDRGDDDKGGWVSDHLDVPTPKNPDGESTIPQGTSPAQLSSASQLHAAGIPCFTPGTQIATEHGSRFIEDLSVGDRVFTRDHGLQPIRWIGQRVVKAKGKLAPVLIQPSVFETMTGPLLVSPQHRILFSGYRAELLFGESEVLVAARHLVDGTAVTKQPGKTVTYMHMMFDCHEVIYANGVPTESFHPCDETLEATDPAAREALLAVFPRLRTSPGDIGRTARRCLKGFEAQMLLV